VLSKLAVTHSLYDDAVTFHVMPYTTLRNNAAISEFKDTINDGDLTGFQSVFLALEGYLLAMHFADGDLSARPNSWRVYWQEAQALNSMAERWELFQLVAGDHFMEDWWTVFSATRDTTYDAPAPVTELAEDETDPGN
jgi:hypothetical protein